MSITAFRSRCLVRRIALKILSSWLAPVLLVLFGGQFAAAQEENGSETALRIEQQQLFEQLRARPDDLDAMFAYAVASILLRDYEQAIATLERMLIYRDDLPRVKLELGSAYFRLGSYEVSRFYFNEALAGDPPPDVRAKVEEFLAEINSRTKQSAFAGFARVGLIYSTNANLGPSDRLVEIFGTDALLDPDYLANASFVFSCFYFLSITCIEMPLFNLMKSNLSFDNMILLDICIRAQFFQSVLCIGPLGCASYFISARGREFLNKAADEPLSKLIPDIHNYINSDQ